MSERMLIVVGWILSLFTAVLMGLDLSFNVYAIELKNTFNFSQTEVNLIASCEVAGMGACLIESFIKTKLGNRVAHLFTWITTSGSVLGLWLSVLYKDLFTQHAGMVAALHFFVGLGTNAATTRLSAISVSNFQPKHAGKLLGIHFAIAASGKLVLGTIYEYLFGRHIGKFFFSVSVIIAVLLPICFAVHKPRNEIVITTEQYEILEDNPSEAAEISTTKMLLSGYFHVNFWPSGVMYGIVFTFMNNLTSIARSWDTDVPLHFVYVLSVAIVIGRTSFGILYDKFNCGLLIIVIASLSMVSAIALLAFSVNPEPLYPATILLGVGCSCGFIVPTALLVKRFGQKQANFILGLSFGITSLSSLIFQFMSGHLYDRMLSEDGFCYGHLCFYLSSVVLLGVCVCLACIQVVNLVITHVRKSQYLLA